MVVARWIEFAFGHREVVRLVMGSACHQADEAQASDVRHFPGIGRRDGEQIAGGQRHHLGGPTLVSVHRRGPGRDQLLDGGQRAAASGDGDLDAAGDRRRLPRPIV